MEEFRAAPPGKLCCVHGTGSVFRLSLRAAAHVLLGGVPLALVDGTNRFDVYALAEFARRTASSSGRRLMPDDLLRNIYISRAFTCYQMEAAVTERLPAFLARKGSPVAVIFGLLDTFYDEQAPLYEVRASLRRVIAALHDMKRNNIAVLLASQDMKPASKERAGLFPQLAAAMDLVYAVTDTDQGSRMMPDMLPVRRTAPPLHDNRRLVLPG